MKKKLLFFLLAVPLFSISGFNQDNSDFPDYQVMSNVLVNMCKFSIWPNQDDSNKPFIITVLGQPSEEEELYISRDIEIRNRKVLIHKIRKMEDFKGSDVLFITSSEQSRVKNILAMIENKPILTVTLYDSSGGMAHKGVMVNFFLSKKNRIAFIINLNSLRKASIQMRANVLQLAVKVIDSEQNSNGRYK